MLAPVSPPHVRPRRSHHPRGRPALSSAPPWPTQAPSWAGQLPRGAAGLGGTPAGDGRGGVARRGPRFSTGYWLVSMGLLLVGGWLGLWLGMRLLPVLLP
jgi:hypothetical protein